jgi:hypothetical protein
VPVHLQVEDLEEDEEPALAQEQQRAKDLVAVKTAHVQSVDIRVLMLEGFLVQSLYVLSAKHL